MSKRISRKTFLKSLGGLAMSASAIEMLGACGVRNDGPVVRFAGPDITTGHLLRDRGFGDLKFDASKTANTKVTIIGAGIAGLSAAWWLKKNGMDDFMVLELEKHVGGNAASGGNKVSSFPWGAHYVPLANRESEYVRELFHELGIITGFDNAGEPIYNDLYLCHDPQERLFKDGSFQEGLVPHRGLQSTDRDQIARFFSLVNEYRKARGSDGKPAFAIPIDLSSADPKYRNLDAMSMTTWMRQHKFDSRPLHWYVNYCCRDDYGSPAELVSAWAGIHYFAGRRGTAANSEPNSVVTWPEGNGYLVRQLQERLGGKIQTGMAVAKIDQISGDYATTVVDTTTGSANAINSHAVIVACPRFIAKRLTTAASATAKASGANNSPAPNSPASNSTELAYAPWLVANLTLRQLPEGQGAGLSWDNVSYNSPSLGYVVATHQRITTRMRDTVITYYLPLSDHSPSDARKILLTRSAGEWSRIILDDLQTMHPGIADDVISIDLWRWGHGMIRPSVGFIWGELRQQMNQPAGKIIFAHSDMSGISNFEEAQYHGVSAAKHALAMLKVGA